MDWNGYATSDQFRKGTELMLELLKKYKASKVLADTTEMVLIGSDDQEWIISDFLPRATESGFKAIALIKPDSYFNVVALNTLAERISLNNLQIKMFDDMQEAENWLQSV